MKRFIAEFICVHKQSVVAGDLKTAAAIAAAIAKQHGYKVHAVIEEVAAPPEPGEEAA